MKKLFFLATCAICFIYTYTKLSADPCVSGVMNAPFDAQVDWASHLYDFHPGYDVYWTFLIRSTDMRSSKIPRTGEGFFQV